MTIVHTTKHSTIQPGVVARACLSSMFSSDDSHVTVGRLNDDGTSVLPRVPAGTPAIVIALTQIELKRFGDTTNLIQVVVVLVAGSSSVGWVYDDELRCVEHTAE